MLMFVGVNIFRSYSNQNLPILIRSCELAYCLFLSLHKPAVIVNAKKMHDDAFTKHFFLLLLCECKSFLLVSCLEAQPLEEDGLAEWQLNLS